MLQEILAKTFGVAKYWVMHSIAKGSWFLYKPAPS